jgi:hypothetical protein
MSLNLIPIELELQKRCSKENVKYFDTYINMKDYLIKDEYPFIRDQNPWYNDHGIEHANAIIRTMNSMLSKFLIANNELRNEYIEAQNQKLYLSTEDIFILLSAAIWHDVAMVNMRKNHGTFLINYGAKINSYVHDKDLTACIIEVASSHSSKDKFHNCSLSFKGTNYVAQIKLLASILRFADEISEDQSRGTQNEEVIKIITGSENEIYWRHTHSIKNSTYSFDNRTVEIYYEIDEEFAFKKFILSKDKSDEQKTLIEFIISRIKKVNDERILCSPFFSSYSPVDTIVVDIKFFKSSNGFRESYSYLIPKVLISSYPHSSLAEEEQLQEFMNAYPTLSLQKIESDFNGILSRRS